ncbi:dihydrofolate reductase family protein [Candidatus Saccharibacteria bacterium]|nr:dihydrofolate reductase family protein [Candidatus Saccharibacteria bacterium]
MKIIWYPAVSLDGYIADDQGQSDWVTSDDAGMFDDLVQQSKAVIVGRKTFDQFKGELYPVTGATTYVITNNTKRASDDPAVVYVAGGALEVMRSLSADGRTQAVLSGGGEINGLFAAANLIDEAWVSVYPLILGSGTKLMGSYAGRLRLSFRQGYALPHGVVHNRYDVG